MIHATHVSMVIGKYVAEFNINREGRSLPSRPAKDRGVDVRKGEVLCQSCTLSLHLFKLTIENVSNILYRTTSLFLVGFIIKHVIQDLEINPFIF